MNERGPVNENESRQMVNENENRRTGAGEQEWVNEGR